MEQISAAASVSRWINLLISQLVGQLFDLPLRLVVPESILYAIIATLSDITVSYRWTLFGFIDIRLDK